MDHFRDLYERYHADVYRFALFLTGDHGRAEDLAADTFMRAWAARDRIRQDTVRAYLLTITRNLYRDELRTRSGHRFTALDEAIPDTRVDAHVQRAGALDFLRSRLRSVAKGDRRALLLYVVKEMSYEEIAASIGVSLSAVKSRIHRAREALRAPASHVGRSLEQKGKSR